MPSASLALPLSAALPAKRARRKEARPGELLAAALELFAEKGFAATRAEEVAHRAGVSKGTLFLYFASKEELFKAVVREHLTSHLPDWSAEVDAWSGSSAELLRHGLAAWWRHVGDTPTSGILRLLLAEARNFPELARFYESEVAQPSRRLLARMLQRGMDSGEFRALDLQHAVHALLAPMLFLVVWKHGHGSLRAGGAIQPEAFLEAQLDIVLGGLCVRSDESAPTAAPSPKPVKTRNPSR